MVKKKKHMSFSTYFVVKKKTWFPLEMFPKKAKPTGPSGWCFAEQCRGWQRRGKLTGAIRGSSFRKPKNIAYLHFTMWFTMFSYMFYWGKWRWAMNQDVQKSQFHGLFLEPGLWKFLPFLARRSLDFGAILVWAAFSRVNLRFFRFLQPASPKAQQSLFFPGCSKVFHGSLNVH